MDFSGCGLVGASFTDADLHDSVFDGADLSSADLSGAVGVTRPQLDAAASLEGAILPDMMGAPLSEREREVTGNVIRLVRKS